MNGLMKAGLAGLAATTVGVGVYGLEHASELKHSWDSRNDSQYSAAAPSVSRTLDEKGPQIDQLDTVVNRKGFNGRVTVTVYRNIGELVINDSAKREVSTVSTVCRSGALVVQRIVEVHANGETTTTDGSVDLGQAVSCVPGGDQFSPTAKADVFLSECVKGNLLAIGLLKPAE